MTRLAGLITGRISPYQHEMVISTRDMCESNRICNPTSMIRNADLKRWTLRYDSSFLLANDFKLWAEMLLLGLKIVHLPDPLIKYRNFDGQATATNWDEMEQEGRDVMAWLSSAVAIKANPGYADPVIEKTGHELTLIIPFLNEGEEVEATVRSFREFGGDRMDIIVINDCSYDSYPYMERLRSIPSDGFVYTCHHRVLTPVFLGFRTCPYAYDAEYYRCGDSDPHTGRGRGPQIQWQPQYDAHESSPCTGGHRQKPCAERRGYEAREERKAFG